MRRAVAQNGRAVKGAPMTASSDPAPEVDSAREHRIGGTRLNFTWRAAAAAVLVMAPACVCGFYVFHNAVDVPSWDQWELVGLLVKSSHGELRFADLHAQHNEHRVLFPRLLMLGLAR